MSGGSYNYLRRRLEWDCEAPSDLYDMASHLGETPEGDATREVIGMFDAIRKAAEGPLGEVWYAVEWHASGDWGPDGEWKARMNFRSYLNQCESPDAMSGESRGTGVAQCSQAR
jgi:hypothetical protein